MIKAKVGEDPGAVLNRPAPNNAQVSRRQLVKHGLAAAATGVLAGAGVLGAAFALAPVPAAAGINLERALAFHNIHTEEWLETVFWRAGESVVPGLLKIDHHLRDYRTGEVVAMDVDLLHLLFDLNRALSNEAPLHVISGYRSPETNAWLAARTSGVAKNSFHMYGRAIDIRLPGCPLTRLRETAIGLGRGGVGYYPDSDFVHLDTGPPRTW